MQGPKFVFLHLKCPHFPFVFDQDGGAVDPAHITNIKDKQYYLGQYKFINKRILEVIDKLQQLSSIPPIIILQSDHGQRGSAPGNGPFRMDIGNDWQDILNAYFVPDADYNLLKEDMSPIDTFPFIINASGGPPF